MNVGATVNGVRPASKKDLREALASNPSSVTFDCTDAFGPNAGRSLTASEAVGAVVVGPDPYSRRNFYGNVVLKAGAVTVK